MRHSLMSPLYTVSGLLQSSVLSQYSPYSQRFERFLKLHPLMLSQTSLIRFYPWRFSLIRIDNCDLKHFLKPFNSVFFL